MPNTLDIQNKLNTNHSPKNAGPASRLRKRILALARINQYSYSVDVKAPTLFQSTTQPRARARGKTLHSDQAPFIMQKPRMRGKTL